MNDLGMQGKNPLELQYKSWWCGYGAHYTHKLSLEGFIEHINECEHKLSERIKNKNKR